MYGTNVLKVLNSGFLEMLKLCKRYAEKSIGPWVGNLQTIVGIIF